MLFFITLYSLVYYDLKLLTFFNLIVDVSLKIMDCCLNNSHFKGMDILKLTY